MSAVGGKAESQLSLPRSANETQAVWKRARAENAQNCFLSFLLSTVTARAVLFLFNVIETNFLRASSASEFSHSLGSSTDLTAPKFDFRFTPESGLKSDIAPCPKSASKPQVTGLTR